MSYTPGPWTILPGNENWLGGIVISDNENCHVATALKGKHDVEANACLIAVAPDMESILRRLAEKALRISEPSWMALQIENRHELHKLAMEAGDVLSKARGMR